MGGGGFMDHAKNTNNDHRSRNKERKANYEKSHPSSTILKNEPTYTSFTVLKDDEIDAIHESVREKYATRIRKERALIAIILIVTFIALGIFFTEVIFK